MTTAGTYIIFPCSNSIIAHKLRLCTIGKPIIPCVSKKSTLPIKYYGQKYAWIMREFIGSVKNVYLK